MSLIENELSKFGLTVKDINDPALNISDIFYAWVPWQHIFMNLRLPFINICNSYTRDRININSDKHCHMYLDT